MDSNFYDVIFYSEDDTPYLWITVYTTLPVLREAVADGITNDPYALEYAPGLHGAIVSEVLSAKTGIDVTEVNIGVGEPTRTHTALHIRYHDRTITDRKKVWDLYDWADKYSNLVAECD